MCPFQISPLESADRPAVEALLDRVFGHNRRRKSSYGLRAGNPALPGAFLRRVDGRAPGRQRAADPGRGRGCRRPRAAARPARGPAGTSRPGDRPGTASSQPRCGAHRRPDPCLPGRRAGLLRAARLRPGRCGRRFRRGRAGRPPSTTWRSARTFRRRGGSFGRGVNNRTAPFRGSGSQCLSFSCHWRSWLSRRPSRRDRVRC